MFKVVANISHSVVHGCLTTASVRCKDNTNIQYWLLDDVKFECRLHSKRLSVFLNIPMMLQATCNAPQALSKRKKKKKSYYIFKSLFKIF